MDCPLNLAHRHQRKAEALLLLGKFSEAIDHHIAAEKALEGVTTNAVSSNVLQSLKLQRDYHIRQQSVIKHKQREAEFLKTHECNLKIIHNKETGMALPTEYDKQMLSNREFIRHVIQTMIEHESLIHCVFTTSYRAAFDCEPETLSRSLDSITKGPLKPPKDDIIRLEELRVNNKELKRTLFALIGDLEKMSLENKILRESLEDLEKLHQKCTSQKASSQLPSCTRNSSLGLKTPYSDHRNVGSVPELPSLEPIEMPKFEFSKE